MTQLTRLVRALASLAVLAVLIVGVPWLLARYGNWPITGLPDRDWWDGLGDSAVSDTTVFAVLTVAAWAVWALFVASVAVELAAGLRGVQAPHLALAGPLQRLARALVVTVLLGLSVQHATQANATSRTFTATASPAPVAAVVHQPLEAPVDAATVDASAFRAPTATGQDAEAGADDGVVGIDAATGETVVLTRRGDSPWRLAERYLGDGTRWGELWERNRDTEQPDGNRWDDPEMFSPNWLIRIPTTPVAADDATTTFDAAAADPAGTSAPTDRPSPGEVVHVVVDGDTLWDLAGRYLGDPTRYDELFDANQSRLQPDGRQLTDPNLILPGWRLVIPTPAVDPVPAPLPPPPAPIPRPPPTVTTPTTAIAPTTTTPVTTSTAPPTTLPPPSSSAAVSADRPDEAAGVGWPLIAGLGGAVVASSAVASRIVWLRRRRGTRSNHLPPRTLERALLSASDVPLVRWAGQHLARLVAHLDRRTVTAGPVAVELSADTGLEVLWDEPQHASPPPAWTVADGGWAWRLAYDADEPVPVAEVSAPIPALVTIGHRQGRQLLIDLEAFGILTVTGPDDRVEMFLRSLAVELTAGDDLADAYVTTDVATGLDGQADRLTTKPFTDLHSAAATVAAVRETLDAAGVADTFRARVGTSTPIEATVIIAAVPPPDPAALAELVPPRSGLAVVTADNSIGVGAHLELQADGTGHLAPLDIDFDAAALSSAVGAQVGHTLDALAALPDEPTHLDPTRLDDPRPRDEPAHTLFDPVVTSPVNGAPVDTELSTTVTDCNGDTTNTDAMAPRPTGRLVVHVLGVPAVADRPDLRRRELALVALLASRGGTLAASAAQDALWGGTPIEPKTVWNLVTRTRRALGDFDDGQPVMPTTDRTRGLLRLDPRVTTDLTILVDRLEQARDASSTVAIGLLAEALDLIDGPPYDAAGYEWAHRDQDVAYASTAIEQTAELLVQLALDADRVDVARDGLVNALRGLPGNENLYRLRMRVEHHAGNHTAVAAAFGELSVYLADLDSEPSPLTTALFHELTSVRHVHSD